MQCGEWEKGVGVGGRWCTVASLKHAGTGVRGGGLDMSLGILGMRGRYASTGRGGLYR